MGPNLIPVFERIHDLRGEIDAARALRRTWAEIADAIGVEPRIVRAALRATPEQLEAARQQCSERARRAAFAAQARIKRRCHMPEAPEMPRDAELKAPTNFVAENHFTLMRSYLRDNSIRRVLNGAALVCGVDANDVCLLEQRAITRHGAPVVSLIVRCAYNERFNERLRRLGARFHKPFGGWIVSQPYGDVLLGALGDYFEIAVDLTTACVWRNPAKAAFRNAPVAVVKQIPFHVPVDAAKIRLKLCRILDLPESDESTCVHDGQAFVPIWHGIAWTRYPFLLFRVMGCRYFSVSTLGGMAESLSYGGDMAARVAIARFIATHCAYAEPVIQASDGECVEEKDGDREMYYGCGAMREHFDAARNLLDVDVIPLCSDYYTMTAKGFGADALGEGNHVYATLRSRDYAAGISRFFGKSSTDGYPIVFAREYIERLSKREGVDDVINDTIAKGLAQWFSLEWKEQIRHYKSELMRRGVCHDVTDELCCEVCKDVIGFFLRGPGCAGTWSRTVADVVALFADQRGAAERGAGKAAVREITMRCLEEICAMR